MVDDSESQNLSDVSQSSNPSSQTFQQISPTPLDSLQTAAKESPVSQNRVEGLRRQREKTRGTLASRLLWLIIGTAFGSFLLVAVDLVSNLSDEQQSDLDTDFASDVITLLITTQSTLAGSAIGFYFGNKQSDER